MNFQFACPICQTSLTHESKTRLVCPQDGRIYSCHQSIWHFLPPKRVEYYAQFVHEYETIRLAEGRQHDDPAYYRALPFQDLSGQMTAVWQSRANTFNLLCKQIIKPIVSQQKRQLRILDLGAGNGWLSYQLAKQKHQLAAIDLTINSFDGLGVHRQYDADFLSLQAEFTHLPLLDAQADITIFNASFHYAEDYEETLAEAWRVTQPEGLVVVVDSPFYRDAENGRKMVQEREMSFQFQYGFPSNALASENYLWMDRLNVLAHNTKTTVTLHWRTPNAQRLFRRAKIRLRGQREAAQFPLVVFRRTTA